MTNAMGGANLHTPPSIFQHMMGQQSMSQQPGPWMHMPQVPPMSIPWSVPSLQQPKLVRFTGSSFEPILHQKRKLDGSDVADTRQTKQFITEEKMTAHFRDLHISNNYQPHSPVPSTSTADSSQLVPAKELNMDLEIGATSIVDRDQTKSGLPKLILSEELKRLQPEPIIPPSLLSKLERPSMALVLWEPPSKHLRVLSSRITPVPNVSDNNNDSNNNNNNNNNNDEDNNNNNNNNNNEAIPNLNQTLQPSNRTIFEPMEL